jgi:hypothetical protein
MLSLLGLMSVSILLKYMKIEGSDILLRLSGFSLAGFLVFQAYLGQALPVKFFPVIQRISYMGMAVSTIGVLFRFMYWNGWHLDLMVGLFTLVLSGFLLMLKWSQIKNAGAEQLKFFNMNYLAPAAFLLIMSCIALATPDKIFYETFSLKSKQQTYEQFQADRMKFQKNKHRDSLR